MRQPIAVVVGAAVAALGAVILGEYDLTGFTALVAGLIFGVAVGEAMLTVGRRATPALMATSSAWAVAGLVWAVWIANDHRLRWASGTAWAGVVLGGLAAPMWLRSAGRRGRRTTPDP